VDAVTLLGMAWALAMDAFAVAAAVSAGLERLTYRHSFRLAWHFGLFQAAMPVVGWWGGTLLSSLTATLAHWIASGLLIAIGVRMLWESRRPQPDRSYDPTRGWSLVGLSIATSIDALAAGMSLGLIGHSIWIPAIVIGGVTMALTCAGVQIGRAASDVIGQWAIRTGGIVLIAIGARILIQHV
jgi:putative Mn2+ efflux pump MntP